MEHTERQKQNHALGLTKGRAIRRKKAAAVCLGLAVGVVAFLLLYGTKTLHVTYDQWILNGYDESDILQEYAGWLLFRNSHWAFPLGYCEALAAPDGTIISFTDSLPWVSIAFKAMRGVLPATFQYYGLYGLFCFAMQGACGALLTGRVALWGRGSQSLSDGQEEQPKARTPGLSAVLAILFTLLGAALFVCLPTLWDRNFRHPGLASQYLFLLAIYFMLEYRGALRQASGPEQGRPPRYPWQFAALAFLSVGIHPYLMPPVMVCALLAAADCMRYAKKQARAQKLWALAGFALSLAAVPVAGFLTGALGSGVSASRSGYGELSMNLNAPWNPAGGRGQYQWSVLLPVLPYEAGQYDGFNYLGAGVLALTAATLAAALLAVVFGGKDRRKRAAAWWRPNGLLLVCCALLTVFALSNHARWGSMMLWNVALPDWLAWLCGVFRSSGRMFYLVGACMLTFGISKAWCLGKSLAGRFPLQKKGCRAQIGTSAAVLMLAAAVMLQMVDLSAVAAQKRALFDREINASVANNEQTQSLGVGHTQLLCADENLREDRLRLLAVLAGKQGLATNLVIANSGQYPQAQKSAADAAEQLAAGQYMPQTVYVSTDESQYNAWQQTFAEAAKAGEIYFFVADSCYFLVPAA